MNRNTDTTKWHDPWFRALSPNAKLLWYYLHDACDAGGAWEPDEARLRFEIGVDLDWDQWETVRAELGDRVLVLGNGAWYLTRFVAHQYRELKPGSGYHRAVLRCLQDHGLDYDFEARKVTLNEHSIRVLPKSPSNLGLAPMLPLRWGTGKGIDSEGGSEERREEKGAEAAARAKKQRRAVPGGRRGSAGPVGAKSALQLRVEAWFHRRPSTRWDAKELAAWARNRAAIDTTPEEDLKLLDWLYAQPAGTTCRRHALETLLNNWNTELSRASEARAGGGARGSGGAEPEAVKEEAIVGENLYEFFFNGELPIHAAVVPALKRRAAARGLPWPPPGARFKPGCPQD